MKKIIALLLLFTCIAFSCERDDICDENKPTTPRIVVEFRDFALTENTKNVSKLRIEDVDDPTRVLDGYNIVTEDQMLLPLKTNASETKYRVYKNYVNTDGTITGNDDIITIQYSTTEVYVSRACGYKTIFNNVAIIIENDSDNWMEFALAENDNQSVINEDEIHYTIHH